MPVAPLTTSPTALLTAIMRTFICFISRLVCTIAVALRTKVRNITLASGTSAPPALKRLSISGAESHKMQ